GEEGVGRGFAGQSACGGGARVDPDVEEVLGVDRAQDVPAVGAGGDDRGAQAAGTDGPEVAQGAVVRLDAVGADPPQQLDVLAVAEAVHGGGPGRVVGVPLGEVDAAGGEEGADTVRARAAVDMGRVVRRGEGA